jgi:hypothetical protein
MRFWVRQSGMCARNGSGLMIVGTQKPTSLLSFFGLTRDKSLPTNGNSSCRCARLDHQRKLEAKVVKGVEWLVAGCGQ